MNGISIRHSSVWALAIATSMTHGATEGLESCSIVSRGVLGDQTPALQLSVPLARPYRKAVFVRSRMPVTSDGAPDAYHSEVLDGSIGLNRICNAVTAYRLDPVSRERLSGKPLSCQQTEAAFKEFVTSGWVSRPDIEIAWRQGLAASLDNGRVVPCIFSTGAYKGFFGTRTALTNGLDSERGECEINNQIDPRVIPGLTIAGGRNFIREAGIRLGDLALAVNLRTGAASAAAIIDTGPATVPIMGTIALNSTLLRRSLPETLSRRQVLELDIGSSEVAVVLFPGTAGFRLRRPYSMQNITERVETLISANATMSISQFSEALLECVTHASPRANAASAIR